MPKVHNIGSKYFVQLTNFPFKWGFKVIVRGWTQEIEPPYRTSTPYIVRLPRYKALALGKWEGTRTEEEALNLALERRDLTYEDFSEEAGWTPAPDSDRETGIKDFNTRLGAMDGTLNVHDWEMYNRLAEESK